MKWIPNVLQGRAAVLLLAVLLAGSFGCGGGGGGPTSGNEEPPPALNVAGGTFDLTAEEMYNPCEMTVAYDGAYDITIDGDIFAMGSDWTGSWNTNDASGSAQSAIESDTNQRGCTVNKWTSVHVTFSSEDEFSGTITYRRRVFNGECDAPCTSTWSIHGVRQSPAP